MTDDQPNEDWEPDEETFVEYMARLKKEDKEAFDQKVEKMRNWENDAVTAEAFKRLHRAGLLNSA